MLLKNKIEEMNRKLKKKKKKVPIAINYRSNTREWKKYEIR